eukprot:60368-Chlamydomonas_euryale.AAC.1
MHHTAWLTSKPRLYQTPSTPHKSAKELGNALWAFAFLGHDGGAAVLSAAAPRMASLFAGDSHVQNVANAAFACAVLKPDDVDLLEMLLRTAQTKVEAMTEAGVTEYLGTLLEHRARCATAAAAAAGRGGGGAGAAASIHEAGGAESSAGVAAAPAAADSDDDGDDDDDVAVDSDANTVAFLRLQGDAAPAAEEAAEAVAVAPPPPAPPSVRAWCDANGTMLPGVLIFLRTLYQCHLELEDRGLAAHGLKGAALDACAHAWRAGTPAAVVSKRQLKA